MKRITARGGWALALLFGVSLEALAHGDVTPHPIDTSTLKQVGGESATHCDSQ